MSEYPSNYMIMTQYNAANVNSLFVVRQGKLKMNGCERKNDSYAVKDCTTARSRGFWRKTTVDRGYRHWSESYCKIC